MNKNKVIKQIIYFFLSQVFSFIKYSQRLPFIFFMAGLVGIWLVVINYFWIKSGAYSFALALTTKLNLASSHEIRLGFKEVLKIYWWFSLAYFILGTIFKKIFNINLDLSFPKKIKLTLLIVGIGYGVVFFLPFMDLQDSLLKFYGVLSIFLILTLFSAFYSFTIDTLFDFLDKIIAGKFKSFAPKRRPA
jgi:hypothetical protein